MAGATRGLLLVGCGKMGGALLSGWLTSVATPRPIHVVEPAAASVAPFSGRGEVHPHSTLGSVPPDFAPAVVVFATKPQGMETIVPDYRRFAGGDTVILSIAAGRTIGFFAAHLGDDAAIVRAMPNTPAAIGRGISVAVPNARVTAAQRTLCDALLAAVGEVGWVDDERLIDPVTAVSGSGPAYVFLLVECLADAGVDAGLPPDLAMRLARATVSGAGELLHRDPAPAATLRQNVTSPGGTTAAALAVLMADDGMKPLFARAVAAATRRSRELAG
jgi:pyrroline-5-carboxylate reductase